ncbi:manganese-dependent ADP-ribose/CDP-alcohol diphosphatase-like [Pyxicephalus adspersus]|uniref:Manganese-dependent ADP-ribose/CDP-alcohol diphosphatase n=1 Tax=Pyxicephalus adspersus TaxID=30357 RepID=A0AAV3AQ97_PYXAD|nr:TPA: hypothetical protein GDO54_007957 [Pyxicephalus adspersus]
MEEPVQESGDCLQEAPPNFSFGVIADVQYSDKPNGLSSWKIMRYFQQSLLHLQQAIQEWNGEEPPPRFVLQLGDIIDSCNRNVGKSQEALETVLRDIDQSNVPFHHVWGNHELYNFKRDFLRQTKLNTSSMEDGRRDGPKESNDESGPLLDYYAYHFSPHGKFRVVMVDTYDLGVLGRKVDSKELQESLDFLERAEEENPNGSSNHLVTFNGGLGPKQLSWLDEVLTYSDQHHERVIIVGHTPIHPKAKRTPCLAWNYQDILRVIHSHQCVVCYFAGHDHSGGYHQDSQGIHHVTMEGVIESPPDTNAFGTVDVFEDRMVLRGRGRVKSRILLYREIHPASSCCCLTFEKKKNL